MMLPADRKALFVREAFRAIMEQTGHSGILDVTVIAHGQRSGRVFHPQRMLEPLAVLDLLYLFSKLLQTRMIWLFHD